MAENSDADANEWTDRVRQAIWFTVHNENPRLEAEWTTVFERLRDFYERANEHQRLNATADAIRSLRWGGLQALVTWMKDAPVRVASLGAADGFPSGLHVSVQESNFYPGGELRSIQVNVYGAMSFNFEIKREESHASFVISETRPQYRGSFPMRERLLLSYIFPMLYDYGVRHLEVFIAASPSPETAVRFFTTLGFVPYASERYQFQGELTSWQMSWSGKPFWNRIVAGRALTPRLVILILGDTPNATAELRESGNSLPIDSALPLNREIVADEHHPSPSIPVNSNLDSAA